MKTPVLLSREERQQLLWIALMTKEVVRQKEKAFRTLYQGNNLTKGAVASLDMGDDVDHLLEKSFEVLDIDDFSFKDLATANPADLASAKTMDRKRLAWRVHNATSGQLDIPTVQEALMFASNARLIQASNMLNWVKRLRGTR